MTNKQGGWNPPAQILYVHRIFAQLKVTVHLGQFIAAKVKLWPFQGNLFRFGASVFGSQKNTIPKLPVKPIQVMVKNELFADFSWHDMLFQYDVCSRCKNQLSRCKNQLSSDPGIPEPRQKKRSHPPFPLKFHGFSGTLCLFFSVGGGALRPFFV